MLEIIKKYYWRYLGFLAKKTDEKLVSKRLHNLILSLLITSILMWSYTFNVLFTLPNYNGLHLMAVLYSVVHFLAPLIYRFYPSITFCSNLFLLAGFMFQFHYSMVTGGFFNTTPIWFSILPLIAGIVTSKKNLLVWILITFFGLLLLFVLDHKGFSVNYQTNSSRVWAQINISVGYIVLNSLLILAYITYRDRDQKQLMEKTESVKQLLRIISHDILNPLTSIKISTEYNLRKNQLDEKTVVTLLNKNLNSLNDIKAIIDNARYAEAMELGKVFLKRENVSIVQSLDKALECFKYSLLDKGITVDLQYPASDVIIKADRHALENNVFCNLLSNAIKFSPENSQIKISIAVQEQKVSICFSNQGRPIESEKIPLLFSEYHPTSKLGTKGESGTGFGLPIVKNIVTKLGGEISVTTLNGQETQFTITFPIAMQG